MYKISIEFCLKWGYIPRAARLAEELLETFGSNIIDIRLITSSGGVFEIKINNELIFSKKEQNRFPEEIEIIKKIKAL